MVATALAMPAVQSAPATHVYFDQNEEQDYWTTAMAPYSGLATRQIVPVWDTNGQMCVFPAGSGRFTVGYNPTGADQRGPDGKGVNGGYLRPRKQPPVGVAVYRRDGSFTGTDLFVPGPYKLTPSSSQWSKYGVVGPDAGGDVPPDSHNGPFNSRGTYTGCAFGAHGNLFAVDLGTAQGGYPPADDGRLLEWFADSGYRAVCVVYGPNRGGDVWPDGRTHHVDGHGGLQQPGIMASDAQGNIYVPVDEADPNTFVPQGKVLKFPASRLPRTAKDCPTRQLGVANGDQTTYHVAHPATFIDAARFGLPFPAAIARDPRCRCWAVDNVFFGPIAVAWFGDDGSPVSLSLRAPIPADFGGQFSPYGMAFDRDGVLFVADIHVEVDAVGTVTSQSLQAGPATAQGRLLEIRFSGPIAGLPKTIASGEDFPVAVTTCDPAAYRRCPAPPRSRQRAASGNRTAR